MKNSFLLFVLICLGLACQNSGSTKANQTATLPFYNSTDYTPEWISPSDKAYESIHAIAPFSFTDHHGKEISNKQLAGKIYVANFFFTTCPTICPKLTSNMDRLHEKFINQPELQLISHTVMPWKDSVSVLNAYAERLNISYENWKLVTGDEDEIYRLARNSYFADEQFGFTSDELDFLHTDKFILVDRKQRIRGIYTGLIEEDIIRLEEDINILLKEN